MKRSPLKSTSSANLRLAFLLNLGFTVLELVGGILTNSLAIISGVVHDLGDTLSLGLAWYLNNMPKRKETVGIPTATGASRCWEPW